MPLNRLLSAAAIVALAGALPVSAQPRTSFTYQGWLTSAGSPTTSTVSVDFRLFDDEVAGTQIGSTVTRSVTPADGVFSESLDFGAAAFAANQALWLEIEVEGEVLGRQALEAAPFALNTRGISVDQNGHVGIGTNATNYALTTFGGALIDGIGPHSTRFSSNGQARFEVGIPEAPGNYSTSADIGDAVIRTIQSSGKIHLQNGSGSAGMTISNNNFVGIGTASPERRLDVRGSVRVGDGTTNSQDIDFFSRDGEWQVGSNSPTGSGGTDNNIFYIYDSSSSAYALTVMKGSNRVGIGTISPASMLDVNGAVTIRGGADIVEGFDSACGTVIEPGTLMVIDPEHPGKLMPSSQGYDAKVAGIVSGANGVNPGIKLGQDGTMDGDIPVAMTGRVYVKASAENGAIRPGDRLTSASLVGHAMKATDRDRADGAVIGKAMTGLDDGTGMVLVLVNLQ